MTALAPVCWNCILLLPDTLAALRSDPIYLITVPPAPRCPEFDGSAVIVFVARAKLTTSTLWRVCHSFSPWPAIKRLWAHWRRLPCDGSLTIRNAVVFAVTYTVSLGAAPTARRYSDMTNGEVGAVCHRYRSPDARTKLTSADYALPLLVEPSAGRERLARGQQLSALTQSGSFGNDSACGSMWRLDRCQSSQGQTLQEWETVAAVAPVHSEEFHHSIILPIVVAGSILLALRRQGMC